MLNLIGIGVLTIGLLIGAAVPAAAERSADVDQLLRTVFRTADTNRDGSLQDAEIKRFADTVFLSMDSNGNNRLTKAEFDTFSFGLRDLAQRHDRVALYSDARERLWQRWRTPKRLWITKGMFRQDIRGEFLRVAGHRSGITYEEFKHARFVRELTDTLR